MASSLTPVAFNFHELAATFSEICPDYNENDPCGKSESLGFASKILFELGPQMHNLKKYGKDKTWCTELQSSCNVFVYTHRFSRPTNVQPKIRNNKLYLTLKQAALLATAKLCRIVSPDLKPTDRLLLTPMARAIFMPQSLAKIALDLSRLHGRSVNIAEVLRTVNSSCQADGFHLADSVCHVAVVAVETSVVNVEQRLKIREKTKRMYKKHGKDFDVKEYEIFARHSKMAERNESLELISTTENTSTKNVDLTKTIDGVKVQDESSFNANFNTEILSTKNVDLAKTIEKIFKNPNDPTCIEIQPTSSADLVQQMPTLGESIINETCKLPTNADLDDWQTFEAVVVNGTKPTKLAKPESLVFITETLSEEELSVAKNKSVCLRRFFVDK